MTHPVITISRQYGSGGRLIGETLAKELGIKYYDRELIDMVAQESGLGVEYIKAQAEKTPVETLFSGASFGGVFSPFTPYVPYSNIDKMFFTQSDIIRRVAEEGPCVIVGRCADFILREYAGTFSVFFHANKRFRIGRVIRRYGIEPEVAHAEMSKIDKHRASYYCYYTDAKWGETGNYNMAIDSAKFGVEASAQILVDIYRNQLLAKQ